MGRIILASTSPARIALLTSAGVPFTARAAGIDERAIERPLINAGASPAEIAEALAAAKATSPREIPTDALVIGADQTLEFEGERWTKPDTIDAARTQLLALSGNTHRLYSAVAVARGGAIVWHHRATAELTMRRLSAGFIDRYLGKVGETALSSVGAYQIEGAGVQLFDRIDGDYFAILGLPLLPLLAFLRQAGEIDA
jgi:septum formation protein